MAEADLATRLQATGWHYLGQFESPPALEIQRRCAEEGLDAAVQDAEKGDWLLVQSDSGMELFRYSGERRVPSSIKSETPAQQRLIVQGWHFLYNQSRWASPEHTAHRKPRSLKDIKQQYLKVGWPEVLVDETATMADGTPLGPTDVAVYVRVPGAKMATPNEVA